MRKLYFLLPGTKGRFGGGGLWAELNTRTLAQQICSAEVVTYRQREEHLFLDDLLPECQPESAIFIVGWGFDVPRLVSRLRGQNIVYHAHSSQYGFNLPPDIPIIAVSRNTMGYWGQRAANGLVYYLPNCISDEFCDRKRPRDIDILVQTRKSSAYLLEQLIPALQSVYKVEMVDRYIPDLAGLFNRSKIYLYDSAEYWAANGVTEGFGLPPLEALACGCAVFSSVNHGLADYLDPGFNCHKIACYSLEYDLQAIARTLQQPLPQPPDWLEQYRSPHLVARLEVILTEINRFFDWRSQHSNDIPGLNPRRINQLKLKLLIDKLQRKLKRK